MADTFRPPLEGAALLAALDQKLATARGVPLGFVEPVILRHRNRQAGRKVSRQKAHSVASVPKIMLETGVTMGPEITIETSALGTCAVEAPRIWRTASICNSNPCM